MSFSFKGGALLDPSGKEGATNLMVSLLDEGTENFKENKLKLSLKENGTKISLSAEKEKIEGTFQVVSSQIQEGFWLLYESINKPLFNSEDITKIKKQIQASIKIDKSVVSTQASNKFNESFFKNSLFSRNLKGTSKSLKKISRNDILKIHKESFTKNNLTIGVAGDIDSENAKKYIDYVFGELPSSKAKRKTPPFKNLEKGKEFIEMETPQSTIVFGQRGFGRKNKDYFAARVLNYVLGGGGFQSRLYKEVREKNGLVYSIYSYLMPYESDGVIIGGFQTRNKNVNETILKVKQEWKKMKNQGISSNELKEAKTYYKGSFSRNFTSTISIATLLKVVQYYDLGKDYFANRSEIIDNLNLKEINSLASRLFDEKNLFFMIVGKRNM
jgi:zinc protease